MDVTDLRAATAVVVTVLRDIPAPDWDRPTPCPDWTVRQLVHHLVVGTDRFATRLGRETTTTVPSADASPDELLGAWEASTAELAIAFSGPALERIPEGRSPFGTPQAPAPEADAQDRLAALLGRQPASSGQS